MPRVCSFTGRKTSSGNTYTHRGKAKYLGGVGIKITGKTKRKFRPNIQTVTAIVDGSIGRIKVSTRAMKMGLVIKPLRRRYAYRPLAAADSAATDVIGEETVPATEDVAVRGEGSDEESVERGSDPDAAG